MVRMIRKKAMQFACKLADICDESVFEELGGRDYVVMTMFDLLINFPGEIGSMLERMYDLDSQQATELINEFDDIYIIDGDGDMCA